MLSDEKQIDCLLPFYPLCRANSHFQVVFVECVGMEDANHFLNLKVTTARHITWSDNVLFNFGICTEPIHSCVGLKSILPDYVLYTNKPLGVLKNYEFLKKKTNKTALFLMKQTPSDLIYDVSGWLDLLGTDTYRDF